ncbi:Uncharacterized protein TCM_017355 [Theobroma cacao]|uniref:Uncharacterized protein n=1 Tax=Theobroma cacao TaxID=3641 RepID=A0A061EEX6_THECC|nr:Uncharacterized protein TCM_017355 [Theobroma cacao]
MSIYGSSRGFFSSEFWGIFLHLMSMGLLEFWREKYRKVKESLQGFEATTSTMDGGERGADPRVRAAEREGQTHG